MASGAIIGLDIGNNTIKVAEVRVGKSGAYVSALGIAPTPLDSMDQNMILDAQALGSAIKELLSSCGARTRAVVSSVAGQQSLVVRIIEVPRMSAKELAETMKWEVERHVPFASQDIQMDYRVISPPDLPPEVQTMEVLLVVAQREMIDSHLEVLKYAGLDPRAIDVEPLAEPRAVVDIRGAEEMQKTVALVNIGANLTDVSIVRNGTLLFQRTIPTAGNALTQAIADALNISKEEA
ncbi:MAG: type IV pilus assembly protein PilM, partial [Armatimonadota bacterium]|nr:type IV pilus assembly protein PilM [Armatimonadota bacterium]